MSEYCLAKFYSPPKTGDEADLEHLKRAIWRPTTRQLSDVAT